MVDDRYGPVPPKPTSWADVFAITHDLSGVSIQEIEEGRVDWEYDFTSRDMRHCGREGCKQVHGHGWVVALRGGRYVHVGKDCAQKYANATLWNAKVGLYNERIRREAQAEALILARDKAQAILWWIDTNSELAPAVTLYRSFQREAVGPLLADLQKRAEKGEAEIRHEVRLSPQEVVRRREARTYVRTDGSTSTPHVPTTEFVIVGVLKGVRCFRKDISLQVRALEKNAFLLLRSACNLMEKRELDLVRDVMNSLTNEKREIERAVADIWQFFSKKNLRTYLNSPLCRKQGVTDIAVIDGEVVVTRRVGWASRAA